MLKNFFFTAVILLFSIAVNAQTTIYLPDVVSSGVPALVLNDGDPVPGGYSAATDQECAQEIIDNDPWCIEEEWDGICQDAYDECVLANCPDILVCLPDELAAGPAVLICGGDPIPEDYSVATDQVCAQQVVDDNPECLEDVWDTPCLNEYNLCQGILPTCDDGIMNGEEIGVDCGGPDCPECEFIVMNGTLTASSCETTIFDHAIFENYANDRDDTLTICSDIPGECINLEIINFQTEACCDELLVFAGPDTDSPFVVELAGTEDPGTIISPGTECVTLVFNSDFSVTNPGFEIAVTCACPTCDDGILNGQEIDTDCGGPDCPACDFNVISEEILVTSCDAQLFDTGINGDYLNNEDYTMTFCTDGSASCLQLDFTSIDIAAGDHLYIYDGPTTDGILLEDLTGTQSQETIIAPQGCVTFNFVSNGFTTAGGFDIAISCTDVCPTCDDGIQNGYEIGVDCGGPDCPECPFIIMDGEQSETTCESVVFDNGFDGNYANNSNDILTLCSDIPGECIQLNFLSFDIEQGFDDLIIYAGDDITAPIYGEFTGTNSPGIVSPGTECVTIQFTTDGSVTDPGYEFEVSCACPTCDDGILNGQEIDTDCGGPDCPACDFNVISEEVLVTSCDAQLFDTGINGDYGNNEDFTMTFCTDGSASCLQLDFTSIDIAAGDHLYIYDGPTTDGILLEDLTGTQSQETIIAPQGCVTFNFVSNGFTTAGGFDIAISCTDICPTCDDGIQNGYEIGVDCGGPDCPECPFIIMDGEQSENTCESVVYDNGFQGDYSNNSNDVLTLCSDIPGECIQLNFLSFELEQGFDNLIIYAGDDITAPVFGSFTGTNSPGVVNPGTECVTIQFTSDGSVTDPGYEFEVSCACPTCDDGIQNGEEIAVDCGGPDCPPCAFNIISEELDLTTCIGSLLDSGVNGDYGNNEDFTFSYCSPNEDDCMLIDFLSLDIGFGDHLYVYDGEGTGGFLLADLTGTTSSESIVAPSGCVTFNFTSDGFGTAGGFELDVTCTDMCPTCDDGIQNGYELGVDCGAPGCEECDFVLISQQVDLTTCSGEVLDSGGNTGDYENSENYTMTICADDSSTCLTLDFTEFQVENFFDQLDVYAGTEAVGAPINSFTGNLGPFTYEAPVTCITLNFTSDGSVTNPGFQFNIACGECPMPNEQDCIGATDICSDTTMLEEFPGGTSVFPTVIPFNPVGLVADNAVWYTFTVEESGMLSFFIENLSPDNDFDWGLFNLTDATCADIETDVSLLVSANTYGLAVGTSPQGTTGMSTAAGGVGDFNGPGDINGPILNEDYPVVAGETYVLMIQNFTGTQDGSFNGFSLDFSQSTAVIFEPIGPDLESVDFVNCGNLLVNFENPVDCETLDAGDFLIESDFQVYTVDSIQSACDGLEEVFSVELFVSPALPDVPDSISISFVPGSSVIEDLCGNPVPTDTVYDFVTPQWIFIDTEVVNTICDQPLGSIEVTEISGGVPPYELTFEGIPVTDSLFTDLVPGVYTIEVTDDIGCHSLQEVEVLSDFINSEIDTMIVNNCGLITLSFTDLVDCSTVTPAAFSISSVNEVYSVSSIESDCADGVGQVFELSVTPLLSDFADSINVMISVGGNVILDLCGEEVPTDTLYPINTPQWVTIASNVEPTECLSSVGSIELVNIYAEEPYVATFEGEPIEEGFFIDELELGEYELEITDANGCHLIRNFIIGTDIIEVDILIPNIFTPNGDDVNPLFGPFSIRKVDEENLGLVDVDTYFDTYELQVFNRWGKMVFESNNSNRFWDGEDSGGDAAEGTYYYVLKFREACTFEPQAVRTEKGYVTLVR